MLGVLHVREDPVIRAMPGGPVNGLPEWRPYRYRGTGTDTLTAFMDERKTRKPPKPRGALKPCGTVAALRRHKRHGEEPCDACKAAKSRYEIERYKRLTGRDAA